MALFDWLAEACPATDIAWDCATGNGQAARSLAEHFSRVIATDASEEQIAAAAARDGIRFRVAPAERSGLDDNSVELITVAQALHWFDVDAFFTEATRVLRPGGVLAYWCYGLCEINDDCDRIVADYYASIDAYWPPERDLVEAGYRTIAPPLPTIAVPDFHMQIEWTALQMLDYLDTWSASQRARQASGADPLAPSGTALLECWGSAPRIVRWPLIVTAMRAPGH